MEYINGVLKNFEEKMEQPIFEEDDIFKLFGTKDVVIELIMEGFFNIYRAYSESHSGTICFTLENNYLIQAYIDHDKM